MVPGYGRASKQEESMRSLLVLATLFCTLPFAAGANDTTGKLDAGGLVLARTDAIEMASEDLYISPSEVRVAYVFRNRTEEDVDTIVAFPMPDMEATPFANISVPNETSDNFLGFSVEVEGRAITPELEQRAFSGGLDVTQELKTHGIALFPYAQGMSERLVALPPEVRADWRARGMIVDDSYDAGQGMIESLAPTWTLKSTYWWRMTFPAGAEIDVRHRYTPSVGGAGVRAGRQDRRSATGRIPTHLLHGRELRARGAAGR
jgi:hypothetical protein